MTLRKSLPEQGSHDMELPKSAKEEPSEQTKETVIPNNRRLKNKASDNEIRDNSEEGFGKSRCDLIATQDHPTTSEVLIDTATPSQANWKIWCQKWNPLQWGYILKVSEERIVSAERKAGLLSKLTFHWMTPLIVTAYNRRLEQEDIWMVTPERSVTPLVNVVKMRFKQFIDDGQTNPLLWSLYGSFRFEIFVSGLCALAGTILRVVSAFVLRSLIQFSTDVYKANALGAPKPPMRNGVGLVAGITLMLLAQSLFLNQFSYHGQLIGGQSRGVLISMIYEKAMTISSRAKFGVKDLPTLGDIELEKNKTNRKKNEAKENTRESQGSQKGKQRNDNMVWANSNIVNLMSVQTSRIEKAMSLFHIIWTSPMACLITLAFVTINLSYCGLPGFGLLVIGLPASTMATHCLIHRRKQITKVTDQRLSLIHEILHSMRTIKYLCWENSFMASLREIRSREVDAIQVVLMVRNAINATNIVLPVFASILSLITYSLSGHTLTPARVFSTVALFNSLRGPLNLFPLVLGQLDDAWASLKRIEKFLLEEECEEYTIHGSNDKTAILLRRASFTWERNTVQESVMDTTASTNRPQKAIPQRELSRDDTTRPLAKPFKLRNLNFSAKHGELIAVIGAVGSGKSSLLASLAAEMRKTSGDIILTGSRAFCPQYPWIQNTTVQNNITFGKEMNKEKYTEIIKACALQEDFDLLPNGDQTEIGERGITISGGQKQRLSIARALYFDADIVLLDDPLSAVDIHVGRHIFHQAIVGLLKEKCRILATHHLWVLSYCDRVIWIENGIIHADDTYDNLINDHKGFQELMETTTNKEKYYGHKGTVPVKPNVEREPKESFKKIRTLMLGEEKLETNSSWLVYRAYARASGSFLNVPLVAFILLLFQGAYIMTGLWLSNWTSNRFSLSTRQYIGIYGGLGAIQAVLIFIYSILVSVLGTIASKRMHHDAFVGVIQAPMSFFNTTPLGRIMSRFSSDVDVLDNQLANAIRIYLYNLATITSVFVLIMVYFHYFAIALVILSIIFIVVLSLHRASSREIKRLESHLRSRMFAKFSEGLGGIAAIRAYGLKQQFINDLHVSINDMNGAYFLSFSSQRWLAIRLDMIGSTLICIVGSLAIASRFSINPSISGLVLSYLMAIVQMLQMATRQLADVESGMDSVERLHYYGAQLEQEAPAHTVGMRKTWPERGEIIFNSVKMQYRENLPYVLQDLSLHVHGGERMAIVGRTGAGKSSIMTALFRLVEISAGSIIIDGVNISTIGLQDLRSRLVIIPQEPGLFRGTLRANLDPSGNYTDAELWSALRQVGLVAAETETSLNNFQHAGDQQRPDFQLDTVVEQDGANFSLGQRQLVALARALVYPSTIVLCDEATSSVDMETDRKIQSIMTTAFRGKTMLCIAHRLWTVVGYDRICVLDTGHVAELDSPSTLWHCEGIFRSMCDRAGIGIEDIKAAQRNAQVDR